MMMNPVLTESDQYVAGVVGRSLRMETSAARKGGEAQNTKSRWLSLFQRQPDGDWLLLRDTWEEVAP